LTNTLDFSEDEVGVGGPHEGFTIAIPLVQVVEDRRFQCPNRGVAPAADTSLGHFGEQM
jgi:hypothetical protein